MAKPKFFGHLPDGEWTTSTRRYTREWRAASKLVCKMLDPDGKSGWCSVGYEPGLQLTNRIGGSLDVDARLLWALLPVLRARRAKGK